MCKKQCENKCGKKACIKIETDVTCIPQDGQFAATWMFKGEIMEHVMIKKTDWETPTGEIIKGGKIYGYLTTPTKEQIDKALSGGFSHLINGEFLWIKTKHKATPIFCYKDSIEYIKKFVGDSYVPSTLTYEGNGKFNLEIVED